MKLLERFYRTDHFEELLGIVGCLYFVVIVAVAAWVIWFLVGITNTTFVRPAVPPSTLSQFDVDRAQALMKALP